MTIITFTIAFLFLDLKFTALLKHGPAVGVIPVFTPRNPSSSSLFVFVQVTLVLEQKYAFVLTILENLSISIAFCVKIHWSNAVE